MSDRVRRMSSRAQSVGVILEMTFIGVASLLSSIQPLGASKENVGGVRYAAALTLKYTRWLLS